MAGEKILEVRDLVTRFYTYDGVVLALEGVSFDIKKGETVGLVGETGCGKSVTALSVLRLIPSPPGKIEGGEILFLMPPAERAKLQAAEDAAWPLVQRYWKSLALNGDGWAEGLQSRIAGTHANVLPQFPLQKIIDLGNAVRKASVPRDTKQGKRPAIPPETAKALLANLNAIYAARAKYDLLAKDEEFIRAIRGNAISMIFQEPMSALNPVIPVGDQIAENILLHQEKALAKESLTWLNLELKMMGTKPVVPRMDGETLDILCPACKALNYGRPLACGACRTRFVYPAWGVPETLSEGLRCPFCATVTENPDAKDCEKCHLPFRTSGKKPGWLEPGLASAAGLSGNPLRRAKLRFYRRLYRGDGGAVAKFAAHIPFVRRYRRVMYERAMRQAVKMLHEVRIPDPEKVVENYPFELSGGMAQRVLIAIALSCNPQLLIADEPTTALDVTIQAQILKLMRELKQDIGSSVLLITHNLGVVAETCDRVGVMYAGTIVEMASAHEIFKEPLHPYTRGLMESIPSVSVEKDRLAMIHGNVPNLIRPPSGCRFHPRCPLAAPVCQEKVPEVRMMGPEHFVACHMVGGGANA